jgi:hypothetical protein
MVEIQWHSQTKGRAHSEHKLRPKPARQSSTLPMSGDWKREPIYDLPRQSSTLLNGSGGVLCTNSTAVVHFPNIDRRKIRRRISQANGAGDTH